MKTFNIDISIKDLRNKLLDYIACHAHDEALVDIIISCVNENNHSCARLYAKIANLDFPQREALIERNINSLPDWLLTQHDKPQLPDAVKVTLFQAFAEMKEEDFIVEHGRCFAKHHKELVEMRLQDMLGAMENKVAFDFRTQEAIEWNDHDDEFITTIPEYDVIDFKHNE